MGSLHRDAPSPGVRVLTIDRPEARNALDAQMRRDLRRALRDAEEAEDVRAVVLTGADSMFSAGVDLREGLASTDVLRETHTPATVARSMATPVIAAVDGGCYTGGLELALSCSFIVASDRAVFADTHAAVGLVAGWGMSALLPRAVGVRTARRMMATGERIDAETALRWGLVTEVVPAAELMSRASALAAAIAAASPRAVQAQQRLLNEGDGQSLQHALAVEADLARSWRIDPDDVARRFDTRPRHP